jgi:TolB protein
MNADGTAQVNLTDDPDHDDITASWSPDGTRIAFASDRDDLPGGCGEDCNVDVYVMNIDGSDPVRLTDDPGIDSFPEWSPDGSRLLFHSTRAGETVAFTAADGTVVTEPNWDVFVMNADGTGQLNLTNNPAMDAHAVWSPDGTRIAFNSTRDGNVEIYLMDPDGASLTRITNTPGLEEWFPSWSPIP